MRDYALKTGELRKAIEFIDARNYFQGDAATHLDVCSCEAAVLLSQLLAAQGRTSEAQSLRQAAIAWIRGNGAKFAGAVLRSRAEALMLDGLKDEAVETLAEDFRAGDYLFWWYTLKYDPVWLPVHGDPRFQAIATDVQRYVAEQRRQLEELRRRGSVPAARRPDDSAAQLGL